MKHLVFVYGQLKRGMRLEHFMQGADFLGNNFVRGDLTVVGDTYFQLRKGDNRVPGEVYEVADEHLVELDDLEMNGLVYNRELVTLEFGEVKAWVYFYNY